MKFPISSIFKTIFEQRSARSFLLAVLFGFSFSIAVILCTIGLMDGFEKSLKSGLRMSSGDIIVSGRKNYFEIDEKMKNFLTEHQVQNWTPIVQTDGMVVQEGASRGVLIRGVDALSYQSVTSMKLTMSNGVVIGKELAREMHLEVGSDIGIILAKGNSQMDGLPRVERLVVEDIVQHGIYDKDLRVVYAPLNLVQQWLGAGNRINLMMLKVSPDLDKIVQIADRLKIDLPDGMVAKPFWSEYSNLLEAVEIEKISITIILQLIVIISIFNIAALMIFLSERKSREFFLFRALGLSLNQLIYFWSALLITLWVFAAALAYVMAMIFNFTLEHLPFLKMPGEIYVLSRLKLELDFIDYAWVYGLSLIWILLVLVFAYYKQKKHSILHGMRQEFS